MLRIALELELCNTNCIRIKCLRHLFKPIPEVCMLMYNLFWLSIQAACDLNLFLFVLGVAVKVLHQSRVVCMHAKISIFGCIQIIHAVVYSQYLTSDRKSTTGSLHLCLMQSDLPLLSRVSPPITGFLLLASHHVVWFFDNFFFRSAVFSSTNLSLSVVFQWIFHYWLSFCQRICHYWSPLL